LSVFCLTSGFSSVLYFVSLDSFITTEASDNLYIYKDDTYLWRQIERVQIGIETPLRKIIVQRF